ncbi:N-acetylneuraminate synthase [Tumebacillus avium]|uniref:N-acetylneuraminate synthase n=1 Tax=Tumebacillus avium TaxID=1903704 RepID=A0A1Y0IM42_9BACL|nr:N-acetylneuraminate synthase [Tumebacillus avium]ARU60414.1 N-acetylneuraminate synthase [Tumebacillus avium]
MSRTYIIAEAGVNHNGSLDLAKQLIDAAVEAGADAVKFQTFKTEKLVSKTAEKAEYQKETTGAQESQFEMIKKLELDEAAHRVLIEHCGRRGIQFLSTPFDLDSVDLLAGTFDLPRLKAPSGEITNAPLLLKMARTGKPIIVSTGMSTLGEVETALGVLAYGYLGGEEPSVEGFQAAYASEAGQRMLQEKVTLLHCTTEYPTPYGDVNLRAMDAMGQAFQLPVGYSDHTPGIAVPIGAVARGAVLIEKHFTLDRSLPGPDHQASLEPDELKAMVDGIRQIEAALGIAVKAPVASELKNKPVARKSLVAAKPIAKGELFTEENVTVKRPGLGKSPLLFWDVLGQIAEREYKEEDLI